MRLTVANLDFEARVPVPFSIFPSTYKEGETQTTTETTTTTTQQVEIQQTQQKPQQAGPEAQYTSVSVTGPPQQPPRPEQRYSEEEIRIEESYRRPGKFYQETHYHEESRPQQQQPQQQYQQYQQPQRQEFSETYIEVDRHHNHNDTPIDCIEREYRERFQPRYHREEVSYKQPSGPNVQSEYTVDGRTTIQRAEYKDTKVTEETVEPPRERLRDRIKAKMGYYDEDRREEHIHVERETRETSRPGRSFKGQPPREGPYLPNTVTIPCHHIRLGDFLMLQGRPCQVIRISTSAATGQYRYLGVDLFTKQLHEESSFISNPEPSVIVQTMLGPVFKQYRVLDMADGRVVAMTETGDVKPDLPVIDQSNLWSRLNSSFESGRGSVRVLVLNDRGRELAVDMKVIHGSRL